MKRKRTENCDKWEKYFACDCDDIQKQLLTAFLEFFQGQNMPSSLSTSCITVDYENLLQKCRLPTLQQQMKTQPSTILTMLALAADKVIFKDEKSPKLSVRLFGYDEFISQRDLKANIVNQLVCIRGNIVRASSIKPFIQQMAFQCNSCTLEQTVHFEDGKYAVPLKCQETGCRSKSFVPQRDSEMTIAVDWQKIRLQEALIDESGDVGRIPRSIDVEVHGDLVDMALPGDTVIITGIVKYSQAKGKFSNGMHVLYLQAVNMVNTMDVVFQDDQSPDLAVEATSKIGVEFDQVDFLAVQEIHQEPNLFSLLVHSIAPSIFGHELVKGTLFVAGCLIAAGLLLALFGGRPRYLSKDVMSIRSDSHVLIVGDPGMGKSQMLSFVANLAPRGVFVCSNTSTSGGLTVTLTKEAGTGEFALEAGALVLGDQGVCCIDEFDKMNEYEALLEAMEQQSVSIAKAGITCSLPARTSVLAAANPVGGHYNKAKTVSENLKMKSALLSRFDLIFILLDKPNEDMDRFLSEHVMKLHAGQSTRSHQQSFSQVSNNSDTDTGLLEKLFRTRREIVDPIPLQIFRKYIAYAKKYVHPRLSEEAARELQEFYLNLRANYRSLDTAPITTRQLESMIRLAEARAKCELREIVTKRDAMDVVEIMKQSLFETCEDEMGAVQFQRSQMGTGMSRKNEVKIFVARLQQDYRKTLNNLFTYQQMYQISRELNLRYENFQTFLDSVNNQNFIIKTGNNVYKLLIS